MSEFYKMEPLRWDRGTDNLTLEQEAAYLRICNAIYAADQPIAENYRSLAGMWRCNERKAKRLLGELIDAGKVYVEAGWIGNDKALADVAIRRELRVKRQLAGHSGGIESGKVRAKYAETNENREANGSTRREVEESSVPKGTDAGGVLTEPEKVWHLGLKFLIRNGIAETKARSIIGRWRKDHGDAEILAAFRAAQAVSAVDPVSYITKALGNRRDSEDDRLKAWGIGDAKPLRLERGIGDPDAGAPAGAAGMPRMQPQPERAKPEDTLPFGDTDGGWDRGVLPSLRVLQGGLV